MKPDNAKLLTLRGLAIVLVVFSHSYSFVQDIEITHNFRHYFNQILICLRMPLFTVMSGILYSYRPITINNAVSFWKGKSRRLFLPWFFSATFLYLIFSVIKAHECPLNKYWQIFIYSFHLYWFVQALILILLAVSFLELTGLMKHRFIRWGLMAMSILSLPYINDTLNTRGVSQIFSLGAAFYLFPYFLWGNEITKIKPTKLFTRICAFTFIVTLSFVAYELKGTARISKESIYCMLCGISVSSLLLLAPISFKPLQFIGTYSYTIYLYHVFVNGVSEKIIDPVATNRLWLHSIIATSLGCLLPIFFHKIIARFPLLSVPILGIKKKS